MYAKMYAKHQAEIDRERISFYRAGEGVNTRRPRYPTFALFYPSGP